MKKIVLAGGCFWGIEEYFSRINGVLETEVGYANGNTKHPTYEDVCRRNTGFTEACYINYDENIISLELLLKQFLEIIDPTSLNRQGNDIGSQYRTGIYYLDSNDLDIIKKSINNIKLNYTSEIVTELEPLKNYYPAEGYHQKYLKKNPKGYCHINLD